MRAHKQLKNPKPAATETFPSNDDTIAPGGFLSFYLF